MCDLCNKEFQNCVFICVPIYNEATDTTDDCSLVSMCSFCAEALLEELLWGKRENNKIFVRRTKKGKLVLVSRLKKFEKNP